MADLFGEVVEDLRDLEAEIVAVNVGDERELLRDRVLAVGVTPTVEGAKTTLQGRLDVVSTVNWQGHEWTVEGGIVSPTTVTDNHWVTVYQRGLGIEWEPLFDAYQDALMADLREMDVEDVSDHSWWRARARQLKSDGYLGERDSQVYALAELELSVEEMADVLGISSNNVANRLQDIRATYGEVDGSLGH